MEGLKYKIECLRQKMNIVALEKGTLYPDVLIISKKLDKLIIGFHNGT